MKKGMLIITVSLMSLILAGCSLFSKAEEIIDPPVSGGVINNSYDAPKEIKSENITEFSTYFFRYGDFGQEGDRSYDFSVKKENGAYVLSEDRDDVSCDVDEEIMAEIREVIMKYGLVSMNGTVKHTSGLPPEYAPCQLRAIYDSGEELYFYVNNDPEAKWSAELLRLFAQKMHDRGITNFDPPEGSADVVRFELEYADSVTAHQIIEYLVPTDDEDICDRYVNYMEYPRHDDGDTYDRCVPSDDGYYSELSRLTQEFELAEYNNMNYMPSDFDREDSSGYFCFWVDFAYGNQIYGFYDDPDIVEAFAPAGEAICEYVKGYTEGKQ